LDLIMRNDYYKEVKIRSCQHQVSRVEEEISIFRGISCVMLSIGFLLLVPYFSTRFLGGGIDTETVWSRLCIGLAVLSSLPLILGFIAMCGAFLMKRTDLKDAQNDLENAMQPDLSEPTSYTERIVFKNRPQGREYPASYASYGCNGVRYTRHPNGGGLVSPTAQVHHTAFVGKNAMVEDYAVVEHDAEICDEAIVKGNAVIAWGACLLDRAVVAGNATVSGGVIGNAIVTDTAKVGRGVLVCGHAFIGGNAELKESIRVQGHACVTGNAVIHSHVHLDGVAWVGGSLEIANEHWGDGEWVLF
jgi:NDP-sugar pyrophosphorylase family protein